MNIGVPGYNLDAVKGAILGDPRAAGIFLAAGNTVPTDTSTGYAKGCIWLDLNGTGAAVLYRNEGSVTSSLFKQLLSTTDVGGLDLTALTATAAEINAIADADGALYPLDRAVKCDVVAIAGAALHAANLTLWTAPADAVILRVLLDVTTVATGAATVDIGYTAATATTSSNTLLDGVDVNTAVALFDSMDATLASGANAKAQKAASGKWITADEASGDTTGMVANAYIFYILA